MKPRRNSHMFIASILFILIWDDVHQIMGRIRGEFVARHTGHNTRNVVKIGLILPRNSSYPWALQRTRPAIEYALDTIRNHLKLLPTYDLEVSVNDSRCSDIFAPLAAFNMYRYARANVFIGPCCDYAMASIARFSPSWGIPVISAGAHNNAFKNKMEYKLLTRIQGTYEKFSQFFFTITRYFNWTNIGVIYNDNIENNNKGKSNCFFQMEPIYQLWTTQLQTDVWYAAIDEPNVGNNLRRILSDASLYTRENPWMYTDNIVSTRWTGRIARASDKMPCPVFPPQSINPLEYSPYSYFFPVCVDLQQFKWNINGINLTGGLGGLVKYMGNVSSSRRSK